MQYIPISDKVKNIAGQFRERLDKGTQGNYISPKQRLDELIAALQDATARQYVEWIRNKWDDLIIASPSTFGSYIREFERIIPTDKIAEQKVKISETDTRTGLTEIKERAFYPLIIDAMKYKYVQSVIYPDFITQLGIRTCVYCNAQYAFSVAGKNGYHNYELDHHMPKSKYPYLCTTFMNLQPSCSTCNRKKSDTEPLPDEELFQLFVNESDIKELSPVHFELDHASVAYYLTKSPDIKKLKINFSCPANPKLEKGFNQFFKISTLYQAHTDVAEELIWKSRIYNQVIIDDYKRIFKKLGFRDSDFARFILGNYELTTEIHKRPLSKMTQDIARQLHVPGICRAGK